MKQVFEQYASAVIAVFLSLTIFTVIGMGTFLQGKGISQVLGQVLGYSVGESPIVENQAFKEYMSGATPTIREKNVYLTKNKHAFLSDCFEAKSSNGAVLPVFFERLWSEDGRELDIKMFTNGTSICISEPGVYWVQVYAVDKNQKRCSVISKLLVNER
jgi:hypothetical protein